MRTFEIAQPGDPTVLGFTEKVRWNESPNRIALLDTGNRSYLELFEAKGEPPKIENAFWHLAFRVADAGACLEHAKTAPSRPFGRRLRRLLAWHSHWSRWSAQSRSATRSAEVGRG